MACADLHVPIGSKDIVTFDAGLGLCCSQSVGLLIA